MNIQIPPELVNKHRLLTKNEIDSYNLMPYAHMPEDMYSSYTQKPLIDEKLGVPCFIITDENTENANELNEKFIFYVKTPVIIRKPYMYSLYIQHDPENTNTHGHPGGKSKKRKTNKSKKSKKNKTNKK